MKTLWIGLAIGLLAMSPETMHAEQPSFRVSTDLVNVNVSVVGADAQPVQGLTEDQFLLFEDGVPQHVEFFAAGEMPLDVVIMLDTSASMAGVMPLIRAAAGRFTQALRDHDRVTVMGIATGLRILQPLTLDKTAAMRAIANTRPGGYTPLYSSLYTALAELEKVRRTYDAPRRQAIVVLSDGNDTASGLGFEELLDRARRSAVPIYTIAPRPTQTIKALREAAFGETTHLQDFELRRLARETGARAFFPIALQDLSGIYDDIAQELAHQYSIGYQSTNGEFTGEFRHIALRVVVKGVTWRARTGYIAERPYAAGPELR